MDQKTMALRKNCITGTDIAAIMGVSKYKTPLAVYLEKKGLTEPTPDNRYMEWGRRLERVIAGKWEEEHGEKLTQGTFICNGIFGGTPDFYTTQRLVEIKTTSHYNKSQWGESGTDEIPDDYMCQVQWYMGLLDLPVCDVCVLIGGNDYRTYEIEINNQLVEIMRTKATTWWKVHIVGDMAPATIKGDNKKMSALFPDSTSSQILDRPSYWEQAKALHDLKEKKRTVEEEIDYYEALFKQAIGENSGIKGEIWKATWKKTADSKVTDWESVAKALKADQMVIDQFTKIKPGIRRFVFTSQF